MYAPPDPGLHQVLVDDDLVVMGLLVDRRDELGRARTQTLNRLHRLLLELFPGGAKQYLSAPQARALVATTKPRDLPGKTRRRIVVELIGELEAIDRKIKTAEKDLPALVTERGSSLMELTGIGPTGAARCWPTSATSTASATRTASRPGTAPHPWTTPPVPSNGTGSPAPATAGSTGPCTSWPLSSCATPPQAGSSIAPRRPAGPRR